MYTVGAASTPIPRIHRWSSAPRWQARPQARGMDPAQRVWLHDVRWRQMPVSRRQVASVVAASVLLHLLALLGMSHSLRSYPLAMTPVAQQQVMQVELIEHAPAAAPSPPPPQVLPNMQVQAPHAVAPARARAKPVVKPPPVDEAPNPQATAAELFDSKGEVILPAGSLSTATPASEYQAGILNSRNRPAQPQNPIDYKPTRFEKDWVPDGENPLQAAVRKTLLEGTVVTLPGGTRVKCALSPLALAGGCGLAGPEQMSAPLHVEFKRNNLPSATPLIKPSEATSSAKPAVAGSAEPPLESGAPGNEQ